MRHFLILACGKDPFLRERSKDSQHQLSFARDGVNVLFLEKDVDPEAFKFSDGFEKRDRIPRESGYALCDYQVDLSRAAFREEPLKPLSRFFCSGQAVVGEYPGESPSRMGLNESAVIAYLRRKGMLHGVL